LQILLISDSEKLFLLDTYSIIFLKVVE